MAASILQFVLLSARTVTIYIFAPHQPISEPEIIIETNFHYQDRIKASRLCDFYFQAHQLHTPIFEGESSVISHDLWLSCLYLGWASHTHEICVVFNGQPRPLLQRKSDVKMAENPLLLLVALSEMQLVALCQIPGFQQKSEAIKAASVLHTSQRSTGFLEP